MNLCRPPAETNVRSLREPLPLLAFCEWGRIIDAVIFDHGLNNWPISLVDPLFDTCICVAERVKGDLLWSIEDEEEVSLKYCFKGCKWSVKCVHILFHFINSRWWFEIIINFQKYIYALKIYFNIEIHIPSYKSLFITYCLQYRVKWLYDNRIQK